MDTSFEAMCGELARLVGDLREAQEAIRSLSARVLLDPAAEDEAEPGRRSHLQRRRDVLARIGQLVLRAVEAGYSLELGSKAEEGIAAATSHEERAAQPPVRVETYPAVEDVPAAGGSPTAAADETSPPVPEAAPVERSTAVPTVALPDLSRLRGSLVPAWARQAVPKAVPKPRANTGLLAAILSRLGPPPTALEVASASSEIERLAGEVLSPHLGEWPRLPKPVQRQLIAMVAARARHAQAHLPPSAPFEHTAPLGRIFSALTRYSSNEQPGFVYGLQRDHEPEGRTWADDARRAWASLRDELPPEPALAKPVPEKALEALRVAVAGGAKPEAVAEAIGVVLDGGVAPDDSRLIDIVAPSVDALAPTLAARPRFKRLRRALRAHLTGDEEGDDESPESQLPEHWPCWHVTEHKRAVMIGGDLREAARGRLERAFRFASLEWVTTDQIRGPQQLVQSIGAGSVDLVIVLARFMSHTIQDHVIPACKQSDVLWVVVDRGYGIAQVRLAIERFLT